MSESILITSEKIIMQIKLSCHLPAVMEAIVTREILTELSHQTGVVVTKEELQKQADQIRLEMKLYKPEQTLNWLNNQRLTVEEFEEIAYQKVLASKLANHLFSEKVEPFFVNNLLDFTQAEIYEICFNDYDLSMEIFYAIQEGEIDFFQAVHQYIEDKNLRRIGGYRGRLTRKQLIPEVSAAIFEAHPPQVLKPIITSQGVYLIYVEEIIQPELDESLRQKLLMDLFSGWLGQKIAQCSIIEQFAQGNTLSLL